MIATFAALVLIWFCGRAVQENRRINRDIEDMNAKYPRRDDA